MGKSRDEMVRELNEFCDGLETCGVEEIECPLLKFMGKYESCDFATLDDDELIAVYNIMLAAKDTTNVKPDMVRHPQHYNQGKVECIEAMAAATVNKRGIEAICVSNVIKYLFRYETKNGLEDVKKAQFYLNRLIKELESK